MRAATQSSKQSVIETDSLKTNEVRIVMERISSRGFLRATMRKNTAKMGSSLIHKVNRLVRNSLRLKDMDSQLQQSSQSNTFQLPTRCMIHNECRRTTCHQMPWQQQAIWECRFSLNNRSLQTRPRSFKGVIIKLGNCQRQVKMQIESLVRRQKWGMYTRKT